MCAAPLQPHDPLRTHRVAVGLLVISIVFTVPRWVLTHESRARLETMQRQYTEEHAANVDRAARNTDVAQRVLHLSQGTEALERRVRDELGYLRPNEIVVRVESVP